MQVIKLENKKTNWMAPFLLFSPESFSFKHFPFSSI